MTQVPLRHSVKTRITFTMLAIFLVGLWSLAFYASQMLRKDMERLLGEQQFSTASFMAAQINHDLNERMSALEKVAQNAAPVFLGGTAALQAFLEQRPVLHILFSGGVIAYRQDGTTTAEVPLSAGQIGVNHLDMDSVAAALQKGQATIGRPLLDKERRAAVFHMTVPIRNAQGQVVGALSGVVHLGQHNFLEQLTQGRFDQSGSDMLLVAPQERLVITSSDKSRTMEALPTPGVNPAIDRFIQGYEGPALAVNTRGVEVLVAAKKIPATGWYVAVMLPTAAAFAPIRTMWQHMLLATFVLTLLAGIVVWWVMQRQLAPLLATVAQLAGMSDENQPLHALPVTQQDELGQLIGGVNRLLETVKQREEAIQASERKHFEILENVDAHIYLKDTQGRYQFANRKVRELFGASMAQIVGQPDEKFFDADTLVQIHSNDRLVLQEGITLKTEESITPRKDGRTSTYLSVKLPLRTEAGDIYALCGISTDITERRRAEDERRVAAIAFECHEGIVVMDAKQKILQVNQAFTHISGYTQQDVAGQNPTFLCSDRHPASFYEGVWDAVNGLGVAQTEMWLRRQNGDDFPARVTLTAVRDEQAHVTHYVGNLSDITDNQLQEKQRLLNEANHRNILVREVHHRIKNNLQGITGLLRQFAQQHPETAAPINQAIGQVQGISVIHGLQGRAVSASVRLCELTGAIAQEVQNLWQTPVSMDIPAAWVPCIIAEKEAVPIALVLNELILNAVKHGGKTHGHVSVTLRKGELPDVVQVTIRNSGRLRANTDRPTGHHNGLHLVESLMPRIGASLTRAQHLDRVVTQLELAPPVIYLDTKEAT